MKISKKMQEMLNLQINKEIYSAYLYLSMAAYSRRNNLNGFGKWLELQAKEETEHAMKIYNYIYERGGEVELFAIEKPKLNWENTLDMFENIYSHEQYVTEEINKIVDFANEKKDYATLQMLSWFIKEQVEEEAQAEEIVNKLKMIGDKGNGLYLLDKELFKRE